MPRAPVHTRITQTTPEVVDPTAIVADLTKVQNLTRLVRVPEKTVHTGSGYNRFKRDNYWWVDANKPGSPEEYKKSTMGKSHQIMSNCYLLHFTRTTDGYGVIHYGDAAHMNPSSPTDKILITFKGNPGELASGSYDPINAGTPTILFIRLTNRESFHCVGCVKCLNHYGNQWLFETSLTPQSISYEEDELLKSIFDNPPQPTPQVSSGSSQSG